jgi:penicillin-binding protein 1C
MLDVFSRLPTTTIWFEQPTVELRQIRICAESGYLASEMCEKTETIWAHQHAERGQACNFHTYILTDELENYRYHQGCAPDDAVRKSKFVLPAIQSWYYRFFHADYTPIPPYHPSCKDVQDENKPAIIYPKHNAELIAISDFEGNHGEFIFEAAHQNPNEVLFWHLNDTYLGATEVIHKQACKPPVGKHQLKVMDVAGNEARIYFEVVNSQGM